MKQPILELEHEARAWLIDVAAPVWSSRGRTASGLFAERMTLDGIPNDEYFRTFVQARHIYSMVAAGRAGWTGPWRELVGETMRVVIAKARRPDGFYVHRLDRDAAVLDGRADLYDQAFVLFALGTTGGALAEESFFDEAEALLDTIEANWTHPEGGFSEGEIVDPSVRRQNPHMHLFEAFSALHEASGRKRFGEAALAVADLCRTRLVDPVSGALLEYFGEDWTPAPGDEGRIAEPGHCFEWAWLFERLARSGAPGAVAVSDAMTAFGRRHGIDAQRGVAINEVLTDGNVVNGKARLWPQTERLKVAVVRYHRTGADEDLQEVADAWTGLSKYFLPEAQHLWRDKMNEDGSFIEELAPGSSLYHISCAIWEMCSLRTAGEALETAS
ncbi:AGE family epimerase/isomerase [Novosphingobium resinovorum]|uniref:Mannose-6-phosphate isomerase n=1 Tax=Novosphingobium resinovorum TaxID=158500 RepID=A0A1D8A5S5_9SPHN|nr:AGE family epimerase/isomerase [Novosphingobium resinovorum]AOR77487.1 mannose-6-phosphate isomerase [Novosphingobium resinovorum]